MAEFVDLSFESHIKNVIMNQFPNLPNSEIALLTQRIVPVIEFMSYKFDFDPDNYPIYRQQFKQNGGRDIISLLGILLPFLTCDEKLCREISSLVSIFLEKDNKIEDLIFDKSQNKYYFSNVQFGVSNRGSGVFVDRVVEPDDYITQASEFLIDTIQTVSHKLYLNWMNVRPITMGEYKDTRVYQATKARLPENVNGDFSWYNPMVSDENMDEFEYRGIYAGDFYNILVKEIYHRTKEIKWLLFAWKKDDNLKMFIHILDTLFPLNTVLQKRWEELDEVEQGKYQSKWSAILSSVNQGSQDPLIGRIFYYLTVYFQINYSGIRELIENKTYVRLDKKLTKGTEETSFQQEFVQIAYESMKQVPVEDVYRYLGEALEYLKTTWYAQYLIKDDQLVYLFQDEKEGDFSLTLKFFYNFAKSLAIKEGGAELKYFPEDWRSLDQGERDVFCERLRNHSDSSWFNIRRILGTLKPGTDINGWNNWIHNKIRNQIVEVVMEALIHKGLLSKFVPAPQLTDKKFIGEKYLEKQKNIKAGMKKLFQENGDQWEEANYFLTNIPFKELPKQFIKENGQLVEKSYFEMLYEEYLWYSFYAMDWISQISFFCRYMNNRIIYVTGATGQGKSTQVPKLILYALKMIDFQPGKVICTQPRVAPTVGNATRIADEMGVPNKVKTEVFGDEEVKTDLTYIQWKYKDKNESLEQNRPSFLRLVTDGTLFNQIVENPILKEQRKVKKEKADDKKKFQKQNMYDVVIIDEAHEHNKNMDLILTMMRNALYYNNSLKLVIVSATMDKDEPVYRRYYRDINDNLMYPLNALLKSGRMDRINMDRRFHISPPGETTQYRINMIYEPTQDTPEDNGKQSVAVALRIVNSGEQGDVLLFSNTRSEIHKLVEELNEKLPSSVLAIPFYSKMTNKWKGVVEKIDKSIREIDIGKKDILNVCTGDISENSAQKVSKGTYSRAIIVATNVAEASITINSLRFVIDNGYELSVRYDPFLKKSQQEKIKISQSSADQRKGRVGRVADGTVYRLYPEGSREFIQPAYDISKSDIHMEIFRLLRTDNSEKPFLPEEADVNRPGYRDIDLSNIDEENGYRKILERQYQLNDKWIDYWGRINMYDYRSSKRPLDYYQTGYDMNAIVDIFAKFYIVHPSETEFVRDLLSGQVIKSGDQEMKGLVQDKKILRFFEILNEKLMVTQRFAKTEINEIKLDTDFVETLQTEKSSLAQTVDLIEKAGDFKLDEERYDQSYMMMVSYFHSVQYDCVEQVLAIISMMIAGQYSLTDRNYSWITKYQDKNFKKLFGNSRSDLLALLKVFREMKETFPSFFVDSVTDLQVDERKRERIEEYERIKEKIKLGQRYIPNMTLAEYNFYNRLETTNLDSDDRKKLVKRREFLYQAPSSTDFDKWLELNGIEKGTAIRALEEYSRLRDLLEITDEIEEEIIKYCPVNNVYDEEDKILKSFCHGYFTQLTYAITDKTFRNIDIPEEEFHLTKVNPMIPVTESTVSHFPQWVIYIDTDDDRFDLRKRYITLPSNVPFDWIIEIAPHLYNQSNYQAEKFPRYEQFTWQDMVNKFQKINLSYLLKTKDDRLKRYWQSILIQFGGSEGDGGSRLRVKQVPLSYLEKRFGQYLPEKVDEEYGYLLLNGKQIKGAFLGKRMGQGESYVPIYLKDMSMLQEFLNLTIK